ncbi:MAG: hypothetical protein CL930_10225 [Deltaproteobacteria bacterium]|nr:hypothetical protein [Deltaproteobacteria bacterium]
MAIIPTVLGISPGDHGCDRTLSWLARGSHTGGLKALVLREPHLPKPAYVELARRLSPLFGGGLILHSANDGALEVAKSSGWGLHMTSDADWKMARPSVSGLLGVSCHTPDDLKRAADAGADYATVSPVFSPFSKVSDTRPPLGPETLAEWINEADLPVLALGGIDSENASLTIESGVHGVASIGYLFPENADADDCAERAAKLVASIR